MSLEARMGIIYVNGKIMFGFPKYSAPGFSGGLDKLKHKKDVPPDPSPYFETFYTKKIYLFSLI